MLDGAAQLGYLSMRGKKMAHRISGRRLLYPFQGQSTAIDLRNKNMDNGQYSAPVNKLLTYGRAHDVHDWSHYLNLGFSQEHIAELITMLADESLRNAESTGDEMWAPIHAWRILGQLRAAEAIPARLDQLYRVDEKENWSE